MANPFRNMFHAGCPHCGSVACIGECQQLNAQSAQRAAATMQLYQDRLNQMMMMGMAVTPLPKEVKPLPQEELLCATGGIVGWRMWRVPCFGDELSSINGTVWPVCKALRATCKQNHECRGERCDCGLYAWKKSENIAVNSTAHNTISGEVWLWGKVVEHEKGYRAEYSYPKSFIDSGADAKRLAQVYRVKLIQV